MGRKLTKKFIKVYNSEDFDSYALLFNPNTNQYHWQYQGEVTEFGHSTASMAIADLQVEQAIRAERQRAALTRAV